MDTGQPQEIRRFYDEGYLRLSVLTATGGSVGIATITLRSESTDGVRETDNFRQRIGEISRTRRVISAHGLQFEIAEANVGGGDVTLHVSTYGSSISGNPGNAAELAFAASGRHVVYLSNMGRGGTSGLCRADRGRFARTGSIVADDAGNWNPLSVCHALAESLESEGIGISHLRSDSAGRTLTSGLAAVLPPSQIRSIYQNSPPGVTARSSLRTMLELVHVDRSLLAKLIQTSPDPDKVDGSLIDQVQCMAPQLFRRNASRLSPPRVAEEWSNFLALARPVPSPQRGPALRDLRAVAERQPRAIIALVFGGADALFRGVTEEQLKNGLSALSQGSGVVVRCVIVPGVPHGAHAAYPQFYGALEYALTRMSWRNA